MTFVRSKKYKNLRSSAFYRSWIEPSNDNPSVTDELGMAIHKVLTWLIKSTFQLYVRFTLDILNAGNWPQKKEIGSYFFTFRHLLVFSQTFISLLRPFSLYFFRFVYSIFFFVSLQYYAGFLKKKWFVKNSQFKQNVVLQNLPKSGKKIQLELVT